MNAFISGKMAIPVLLASLALADGAQAQAERTGATVALEEVVVTAQRREETLQSTHLSISVLSADDIQKRGITNSNDLIGELSGVGGFESPGTRGASTLSIRGMTGGAPLNQALSAAVAIYVDGVYLGKQRTAGFDVAEIQRIEVLKGPQGTLYGRNSTGGAVNIITRPPSGELGAKVSGILGKYDQQEVKINVDTPTFGDVSGPLGSVAASFGYQNRERDGFYDNTVPGEPDFMDTNREAFRAAVDWQVTEDSLVSYRFDSSRLRETDNLLKVVDLVPLDAAGNINRIDAMRGVLAAAQGWAQIPGTDPRISQRLIPSLQTSIAAYSSFVARGEGRIGSGQADHMPFSTADVDGHSLTFSTSLGELGFLGNVDFKSITAYREMESSTFGDLEDFDSRLDANGVGLMNDTLLLTFGQLYGPSSGFAYPLLDSVWAGVDEIGAFHTKLNGGVGDYRQFSQELQLIGETQRTEYVLGLYYFDDKVSGGTTSDQGAIYLAPLSGGGRASSEESNSMSESVFGQVKWTPGWMDERLAFTAGLRYTHEDKDVFQSQERQVTLFGVNPASVFEQEENFYNLSGAFTVAYDFTDSVTSFLRYSTGYRSGGFNTGVFGATFDEETIEQIELGLKSEWFDNRLRVNGALWTYEWEDGQITQAEITEDRRALSFIGNGGDAERWGGELEILALPTPDLLVSLTYAYINGDYDTFPDVCGTNLPQMCFTGEDFARRGSAPDNSLSAALDYVFLRAEWGTLRGYLQANWQDAWYENALWSGIVGGDPVIYDHQVMDERTLVNARLSLQDIPVADGQLSVSLWGKNLTDDDYPVYALNLGALGVITEQYGDPRTYGLEVTYEF